MNGDDQPGAGAGLSDPRSEEPDNSLGGGTGSQTPAPGPEQPFRQLGGEDVIDPGATDTDIGGTVGTDGWTPPGVLRNQEDETPGLD